MCILRHLQPIEQPLLLVLQLLNLLVLLLDLALFLLRLALILQFIAVHLVLQGHVPLDRSLIFVISDRLSATMVIKQGLQLLPDDLLLRDLRRHSRLLAQLLVLLNNRVLLQPNAVHLRFVRMVVLFAELGQNSILLVTLLLLLLRQLVILVEPLFDLLGFLLGLLDLPEHLVFFVLQELDSILEIDLQPIHHHFLSLQLQQFIILFLI